MTQDLIKGAAEFKHYHYESGDENLMHELIEAGQNPKYFIISCIDSRCNPGTIFRAKPGIFFAHKAMGAIVRPYKKGTALAAALQFALNYNKVDTIIVLGHTNCGAVKALTENIDDPEISEFISVAQHALSRAKECCTNHDDIITKTEQETVLESADNLRAYPSVAKALEENRVSVKAWQFDMNTGDIKEHDETNNSFKTLTTDNIEKDSRQHG